jgi:hypothetical protein
LADDDFRQKFVADPKRQFEERLGTKLPAALKMSAWQEDENHLHFVIPAKPKGNLGELSDDDLEKVAGGVDILTGIAIGLASVLMATVATAVDEAGRAGLGPRTW